MVDGISAYSAMQSAHQLQSYLLNALQSEQTNQDNSLASLLSTEDPLAKQDGLELSDSGNALMVASRAFGGLDKNLGVVSLTAAEQNEIESLLSAKRTLLGIKTRDELTDEEKELEDAILAKQKEILEKYPPKELSASEKMKEKALLAEISKIQESGDTQLSKGQQRKMAMLKSELNSLYGYSESGYDMSEEDTAAMEALDKQLDILYGYDEDKQLSAVEKKTLYQIDRSINLISGKADAYMYTGAESRKIGALEEELNSLASKTSLSESEGKRVDEVLEELEEIYKNVEQRVWNGQQTRMDNMFEGLDNLFGINKNAY